jgi:HAD superfamily hydrolase (TIGR01549 family)
MNNNSQQIKKAVIFDLDGTLLNTDDVYSYATLKSFFKKDKEFGFELGKAVERNGVSKSSELMGISREQMKQWLENWYLLLDQYSNLFSSVPFLLQNLKNKGVFCAINTNRPQEQDEVRMSLKKFAIDHFFTSIHTALTTGVRKPDPKGINLVLSESGVHPSDCFFVGDSYVDILAGKNASVTTIAVTTGVYTKNELEEYSPHFIIDDILSVQNIVL